MRRVTKEKHLRITLRGVGRWPVWLYQPMVNSLKPICHKLSNDSLLWNVNLMIIKIILKNIYCAQEAFCWLLQCNFCLLIPLSSEVTRSKSWMEDTINIKYILKSYGVVSYQENPGDNCYAIQTFSSIFLLEFLSELRYP